MTPAADLPDPDDHAQRLADRSLAEGDPTGWFEQLYAEAGAGRAVVPWDREVPNPLLVEWLANHPLNSDGKRAIVVGAGRGNDAELISARGFATTAFDVSGTAIEQARQRYPDSAVDYRQADLFELPADWQHRYDLVVEIFSSGCP